MRALVSLAVWFAVLLALGVTATITIPLAAELLTRAFSGSGP